MAAAQADIDAYVLTRLRISAGAVTVSFPFPLAYVIATPNVLAIVLTAMTLVVGASTWWVSRFRPLTARQVTRLSMAVGLAVQGALMGFWVAYQDPHFVVLISLILATGGIVQIDPALFVQYRVLVLGGCAGLLATGAAPWSTVDMLALVGGSIIGVMVHISVRRFVVTTLELRALAEVRSAELAVALASVQRENEDRQRVEAERERLRDQLMASQKMEALGTLAGGVAHDVNNVLGGITALADLLRSKVTADGEDDLAEIQASCRRGAELTRSLLTFSRRGQYRKSLISLETVVAHVLAILRRTIPKTIRLESSLTGALVLDGDPSQLAQATLNLCVNAIDAMPGGGVLTVAGREEMIAADRAARLGLTPGRHVAIVVRDTGTGFDEATRGRLFEPFFTTKPQGKGTGLGLAMVYGMVTAHAGAIEVTSTPGAGAEFALLFPLVDAPAPAEAPVTPDLPVQANVAVLVVDDDTLIRTVARRILEQAGYTVLTAEDGAQALEVHARHPEIGVVLLDMSMPVMGGADCFEALRARAPGVRVVLASGYAIQDDVRACLAHGALGFMEKPFSRARLLAAIALAAQGQRLPALEG